MDSANVRIDFDLPCRQCGFNLRTMLATGNCPECGLAVERSLPTDRLADADPAWLEKLKTGVHLILWSLLLGLILGIFGC